MKSLKLSALLILFLCCTKVSAFEFNEHNLDSDSTYKLNLQNHMKHTEQQSESMLKDYYYYGCIHTKKSTPQRKYNQSFILSSGYSLANTRSNLILNAYQDTSSNIFNIHQPSPILSFSHNISLSNVFSITYSLGYQRSTIEMNREKFGSNKIMAFVNPRLTTYRNNKLETYFQLKVGVVYDDKKLNDIKSNTICYLLPSNIKMYTGFTPLGLSYNVSNNIDMNFEWSLWSYETFNLGLKYNFKKNKDYKSPNK